MTTLNLYTPPNTPNSSMILCAIKHQSCSHKLQQTELQGWVYQTLLWHRYKSLLLVYNIFFLLFSYFEPEENRAARIDGPHMLQCECAICPDGLRTPFNPGANNGYTMPLILEGWKWVTLYCCADYWKGQIVQRVLLTLQQTLLNSQFTASMQQAASELCSNSQICNLACW